MHAIFKSHHQSKEAKKRFDDLFTHYQRDLDTINCWDFSSCELTTIPGSVIEWAQLLNKKGLVFHNNLIDKLPYTIFSPGGPQFDRLLLLDLSNNKLKSVPSSISSLTNLLELNLSHNKLDDILDLSCLKKLQILTIATNRFRFLPSTVLQLQCLRRLDISNNAILSLPVKFTELVLLKVFNFESTPLEEKYSMQSIHYIMTSLNPFSQYQYIEKLPDDFDRTRLDDSTYLKRILDRSASAPIAADEAAKAFKQELEAQDAMISRYLAQQRNEQIVLLATLSEMEKSKAEEIETLSRQVDEQRCTWTKALLDLEQKTRQATEDLLSMYEKLNNSQDAFQREEDERSKQEHLGCIQVHEYRALEEEKIKQSMEKQLKEMIELEEKAKLLDENRDRQIKKVLNEMQLDEQVLDRFLEQAEEQSAEVMSHYIKSENVQKHLVHRMLVEQDVKRSQLLHHVEMIEKQLTQMTLLEMKQRDMQSEDDRQSALATEREQLSQLLCKIHEERQLREQEISQLLKEMEQQKEDENEQYWLVQYQRLLSMKPASVASKEFDLDVRVVKLLNKCGAQEYTALFAKHKMTFESLRTLNDDNLRLMGMTEIGLRATLLSEIDELPPIDDLRKKSLDTQCIVTPGGSPRRQSNVNANPNLPAAIVLENECCICMERKANIVFFPCGHVCCCSNCSYKTDECPLCRTDILNSVSLHFSSTL